MEWEYNIEDDIETLHTDGPLHDAVVVLVGCLSSSGNVVVLSFVKVHSQHGDCAETNFAVLTPVRKTYAEEAEILSSLAVTLPCKLLPVHAVVKYQSQAKYCGL